MNDYTPTLTELRMAWQEYAYKDDGSHNDEFARWLAEHNAKIRKEAIVSELRRLASVAEGDATWTESTFLPGPNSDYALRHLRETAEWLLSEATYLETGT